MSPCPAGRRVGRAGSGRAGGQDGVTEDDPSSRRPGRTGRHWPPLYRLPMVYWPVFCQPPAQVMTWRHGTTESAMDSGGSTRGKSIESLLLDVPGPLYSMLGHGRGLHIANKPPAAG